MSILTGDKIDAEVELGNIVIGPYDPKNLNPNSYNIHVGDSLIRVMPILHEIDPKRSLGETTWMGRMSIPEEGVVLKPGELYLVPTKEHFGSNIYVPIITGRSSMGRLGVSVHQEAGFGDLGFNGIWTMTVSTLNAFRLYPGMAVAQVYFMTTVGDIKSLYQGKYQGATDIGVSKIAEDFTKA